MHIKVKGVNNHLVFVFDDSQEFNTLLNEPALKVNVTFTF